MGVGLVPYSPNGKGRPRPPRRRAEHQQAVDALDLQLSDEEVAALQAPYTNAGPSWF
ncbi:hypothetical protein ABT030_03440 [Streptomyces mirabilis]|uniref:hypothetical protein n=1 Tax=Streptomyces mirabilis TaxID=68239 RepID=UPI003324E451